MVGITTARFLFEGNDSCGCPFLHTFLKRITKIKKKRAQELDKRLKDTNEIRHRQMKLRQHSLKSVSNVR